MKKLFLIFTFLLWLPTAHALTTFELVKSLAENGNATAQYNLGSMYATGENANQSYVYAHMWYFFASANDFRDAKKALGHLKEKMTEREIEIAKKLAGNCWKSRLKNCKLPWWDFPILWLPVSQILSAEKQLFAIQNV